MIAVADTTPIRYLVDIGRDYILPELFSSVFVPPAVLRELTARGAPEKVSNWAVNRPAWLEVHEVHQDKTPTRLHAGEWEAIALAEKVRAEALIVDEQAGRQEAVRRGVAVIGTLGLLERADLTEILPNFIDSIRDLKAAGFFLGRHLEDLLVERHLQRRRHRKTQAGPA